MTKFRPEDLCVYTRVTFASAGSSMFDSRSSPIQFPNCFGMAGIVGAATPPFQRLVATPWATAANNVSARTATTVLRLPCITNPLPSHLVRGPGRVGQHGPEQLPAGQIQSIDGLLDGPDATAKRPQRQHRAVGPLRDV